MSALYSNISSTSQTPATRTFRPEVVAEFERVAARYPKREAALMPALRLLEREFGCVDDPGMKLVAELVGVSAAKVYGVFSGVITLPDGTTQSIEGLRGFAEQMELSW